MRALIQRVNAARVCVEGKTIGEIQKGILIFLGVGAEDGIEQADQLWHKIERLRIFSDSCGKINLSLEEVEGEILLVSQFTLYADCKKGNRPSFTHAASAKKGRELYEYMAEQIRRDRGCVALGEFGADMKVTLENDGPFTIWLDTDYL